RYSAEAPWVSFSSTTEAILTVLSSKTATLAFWPLTVSVKVSLPSVSISLAMGTVIVAVPSSSMTTVPESFLPTTSAVETPVMLHLKDLPASEGSVSIRNSASSPSLTEDSTAERS
ncbi:MAG: hypothetical protein ACK55Z_26310, partial [bacterium]